MNKIKKIALIGIFTILILSITNNVYGASYSINGSSATLEENGTTSITISTTGCAGKFEITSSNSSVASVSTSSLFVDGSESFTITAKSAGTATITVIPTDVLDEQYNTITGNQTISVTVASSSSSSEDTGSSGNSGSLEDNENTEDNGNTGDIVVTTPTKSSDANIYSLTIYDYYENKYYVDFDKDTTTYEITVPSNVTKLKLSYSEATGAKYSTSGNENFVEGRNIIQLKITAEDGETTKTYNLYVTREVAESEGDNEVTGNIPDSEEDEEETVETGFGLEKLIIEGLELNPIFETNIYEYTAKLTTDLISLEILTSANEDGAIIEIFGADNLVDGENIIIILVKNEDETELKTYQIIVNKEVIEEIANEENSYLVYYIICAVVGIIIVVVITIIVIIAKKNKKYNSFGDKIEKGNPTKKKIENQGKRFK